MTVAYQDFEPQIAPAKCHLHKWALTTAEPNGARLAIPGAADKAIQFVGNFGGTGVAALEGSNLLAPDESTGTDWFPLTDPQGNAISKSAAGGEAVIENTLWVRPRLTTPGTAAAVDCYLVSRSA